MEFNRFDVTTKELVWENPAAWLRALGIGPVPSVEIVDSDITTLTAAADKVIRVGGPEPFLVCIELQSGRDAGLVDTLCFRQAALTHRHGLTVLTVLVLLRKEANSPSITGSREHRLPDGRITSRYDFQVVRLWQEDPESFLTAEVELLPLAPLTDIRENELPGIVERMKERLEHETEQSGDKLWLAAYILMSLRYPPEQAAKLIEGVHNMKESPGYQWIVSQGRKEGRKEGVKLGEERGSLREARKILIRLGSKRFREPDAATSARLDAIKSLERIEALLENVNEPSVGTWDDLLGNL